MGIATNPASNDVEQRSISQWKNEEPCIFDWDGVKRPITRAIVEKIDERKDIWSSLNSNLGMSRGAASWATVTTIEMRPMRSWCRWNTCEISVGMVVKSEDCEVGSIGFNMDVE
jgi:hypothetical protein